MKKTVTVDEAVSTVERAANGISGAAGVGDVAYATKRRTELGEAAEQLRPTGINVDGLLIKADNMLAACRRRDLRTAVELNIEIGGILAPLCE
jgi:hypothetical protein